MSLDGEVNAASYLARAASQRPDAPALHVARDGTVTSFGELDAAARRLAAGFEAAGLRRGDRVLVVLHVGVRLIATTFALLRLGAVPVFVDPGLGRRHLFACIRGAAPRGMIGIRLAHLVRALFPAPFRSVRVAVSEGLWPGALTLSTLLEGEAAPSEAGASGLDDVALVAFTTGSTGEPKGVCYSHRTLHALLAAFVDLAGVGEGDVHLALLPLLAILGPGLGCATVLPEMDPRRPAALDPARLLATIRRYRVTLGFGSPTPWTLLAAHCERVGATLPSVRRALVGGAPVSTALVARLQRLLGPGGEVQVPYGATEAVPLTCATGAELAAVARAPAGQGTLVGRPLRGAELRLVRVIEGPIAAMSDDVLAPPGEVGEVAVRGGVVTPCYHDRPDADRLAKIPDEGGAWHRMGDLGRLDDEGRLWFCGRKADRVEVGAGILYTTCVEPAFEAHPWVARAALVGVGARPTQRPVLVVEPAPGRFPRTASARGELTEALRALGAAHAASTGGAPVTDVLFRDALPLDVRHNAKILRHELVSWAEQRVR